MMKERLQVLFEKYYHQQATDDEIAEFRQLLAGDDAHMLPGLVDEAWGGLESPDAQFATPDAGGLRNILGDADSKVYRIRRWSWAAAAVAVLIITTGIYFWQYREPQQPIAAMPDVAPGTSKAILILADGSKIDLDSAGNQVIRQSGTAIRQHGGSLQYEANGGVSPLAFNTLTTPRGGQFSITLADGTKVWLNAASSIRYPATFTGKERKVEMTGEAYFEVAPDVEHPFIVDANKVGIQVLGTSFNINAYPEENNMRTTLVSGLIKVRTSRETSILQPGKTAAISTNGAMQVSSANIKAVTAWKEGAFFFENADIQTVMRQLERWYDIQVVYEKTGSNELFSGGIQRNLPFFRVLTILEQNDVRYRMQGRTLIIY